MGIEALLAALRQDPRFMGAVTHWEVEPARPASWAPFPEAIAPGVRAALAARGIERLYSHQAEAVAHALAGRHTVVVTPTASGKSLCFHLPVLQRLRERPGSRALYLFPTKALSQDQVAELTALVRALGSDYRTYTYDGDTPAEARRLLRDGGHVVVTNPYMLHTGILPHHPRWTNLFQNLGYVVIDELHTYRGVFGSHVANVLRRLRRVCAHYGAQPVFLCASATIGNPRELAERLLEVPVALVERSGAPRGERHTVLYNPPIVHAELGLRASAVEQVRRLVRRMLPFGVQIIVFARSRNEVEVLVKYAKDAAARAGLPAEAVAGYRGGYLPRLRRRIEQGLRAGEIRVVVATNALELGVDIGALDVAVLTGYPGSIASFYQQAGRAGRRLRPSLTVLVGRSSPIDQYLLRHPHELLYAPREQTVIDPDNLLIKVNHLKCSVFEVPFGPGESFGTAAPPAPAAPGGARHDPAAPEVAALEGGPRPDETRQILEYLASEAQLLHRVGDTFYWMAQAYPAEGVSLDTTDVDNFIVYDLERRCVLGEVDRPSAMTEIHEGAIYGWQGEQYLIERLDYPGRRAYARKVQCDYFTQAELDRSIKALAVDAEARFATYEARRGAVEVTTQATLYKKVRFYTRENVGAGEIHLPAEVLDTTACWFTLAAPLAARHGLFGPQAGALLALRNLLQHTVPLFVRCDPRDICVWSEVRAPAWGDRPTLYLFDRMPAGSGLAERVFAAHRAIFATMLAVLRDCPCPHGCPGCAGVELEIGPGAKPIAQRLLADLLADDAADGRAPSPGRLELPAGTPG
ncbi:MAG: helicase [Planctomycetota bacterium]|nr:MAG: helicase [Planctomycetota bacterium]